MRNCGYLLLLVCVCAVVAIFSRSLHKQKTDDGSALSGGVQTAALTVAKSTSQYESRENGAKTNGSIFFGLDGAGSERDLNNRG
jgi:Flp pilus assembly protein TadG